jgi:hypothetical protein
MKKVLLITALSLVSGASFAQEQIGNGDMEQWEDLNSATESPVNWSGIKEASGNGLFISFAPQAITRSTDTRTGTGFCAQLEANNALGTTANGTMTCGKLNVGSTTPSDASNYSWSDTSDTLFCEVMSDTPDSIVWWAKYTATNATDSARMKATLHDNYDYQDPEDAGSLPHIVATSVKNYAPTGGWVRMSAPFDYSGPASGNTHILVTFTTNKDAGVGTPGDIVLIDDVELIYNSGSGAGIEEATNFPVNVHMNNETSELMFSAENILEGSFVVYNMSGSIMLSGSIDNAIAFDAPTGTYFVKVRSGDAVKQFKVFKN